MSKHLQRDLGAVPRYMVAIAAVCMGMLNAHGRFAVPALAPAVLNLVMVVVGLVLQVTVSLLLRSNRSLCGASRYRRHYRTSLQNSASM